MLDLIKPIPSRRGGRSAFTLIELLIVMSIIAVLISLALPAMMKARESSNRLQCSNNLRQFGIAFTSYHQQQNYYPTAGLSDLSAPNYMGTSTTVNGINTLSSATPVTGALQEAGWPVQILPFMDAEVIATGNNSSTALANVQALMATPFKFYFCPSRRGMTTTSFQATHFPAQPVYPNNTTVNSSGVFQTLLDYTSLQNQVLTVALMDYAACNGNTVPVTAVASGVTTVTNAGLINTGVVRSQNSAIYTTTKVTTSMIKDGMAHTLLISEKAVNLAAGANNTWEDDVGYFSGFSAQNFNNIRFTAPTLLPVYDGQLSSSGMTGGSFGSAHPGSLNALMADGSVQNLSYTINATIFSGLGTIAGREVITDSDLGF